MILFPQRSFILYPFFCQVLSEHINRSRVVLQGNQYCSFNHESTAGLRVCSSCCAQVQVRDKLAWRGIWGIPEVGVTAVNQNCSLEGDRWKESQFRCKIINTFLVFPAENPWQWLSSVLSPETGDFLRYGSVFLALRFILQHCNWVLSLP